MRTHPSNRQHPPRPRRARGIAAAIVVASAALSMAGCSAADDAIRIVSGGVARAGDDVLRQSPTPAQLRQVTDDVLVDLRATHPQLFDDAAAARDEVWSDPDGYWAISQACGLAVEVAAGQLPTETADGFQRVADVAGSLHSGYSMAANARDVIAVYGAWTEGRQSEAAVKLSVLLFQHQYC
ncbi:hypothetical protein [Agrococcus sp. Marseille-P2731]|uniref:hypothetical protein n=1 Tax=Agrococcus sp. Marseille-P2731 TaxID=1841862 RepID=UPI0009314229|nr:hypothetical protein [Agrococcus sp. Marseille-P2731]